MYVNKVKFEKNSSLDPSTITWPTQGEQIIQVKDWFYWFHEFLIGNLLGNIYQQNYFSAIEASINENQISYYT